MHHDRNDVAMLAKVSTATVSRVFNAPDKVAPDKVARVRAAAKALGYVPDKNASALRRAGTGAIMLVEQKGATGFGGRIYDWFYAAIIQSVKAVVDSSMYQLQLVTVADPGEIAALGAKPAADGIIYRASFDAKSLAALNAGGIPYILVGQTERELKGENVAFIDEESGGAIAARVFTERGYSKPAHVSGAMAKTAVCRARWKGFCSGWSVSPALVDGELGIKGGYESGLKLAPLIRRGKVDCVFIVNDLTAIGVVQALMAEGIRIPRDVALIGYDNLPFIETLPFSQATIDIGFDRLYAEATMQLLHTIKTGETARIRLEPRFVDGDSARPR